MKSTGKYGVPLLVVLAALFLTAHYALRFALPALLPAGGEMLQGQYLPLLERLTLSLFAATVIVLAGRLLERWIERSGNSAGVRYNLVRLVRLVAWVLVAIVGIAFLFQNLYAAAVSFGLISLVLGFALQAPITSFIGWLYIVFRHPYHVGDRIQLGKLRGDVIEIGYLDTLLRECSGDYLGNDRLSGRIIHFPNSVILKAEVINYSGPFRPFIWNETAIQIGWGSDLAFVAGELQAAADADFRARHGAVTGAAREHDAEVYFRVNERAWLEAVVAYPVEPTDTTGRRTRILGAALPGLQRDPQRAQLAADARR